MKRNIFIVLALLITVVLFGACGGGESQEPTKAPTLKPTATPTQMEAGNIILTTPTPISISTAAPGRNVEIGVNGDLFEFDQSTVTVKSGESLTISLKNSSSINQHNWVLVEDGAKDEIATLGLDRPNYGYVPQDVRIVISTKLIDAGQTGEVSFNAPSAGTYQFVCTFPGHSFTMWGTLEVEA